MAQAGVVVMFRRGVPAWNETRNEVERGGTEGMHRAFFGVVLRYPYPRRHGG